MIHVAKREDVDVTACVCAGTCLYKSLVSVLFVLLGPVLLLWPERI